MYCKISMNQDTQREGIESLSVVTVAAFIYTVLKTVTLIIFFLFKAILHALRPVIVFSSGIVRFWTIMGDAISHEFSEQKKIVQYQSHASKESVSWSVQHQNGRHIAVFVTSVAFLFLILGSLSVTHTIYSLKESSETAGREGFSHLMQGIQLAREGTYALSSAEFKRSESFFTQANSTIHSMDPTVLVIMRATPFIGKKFRDAEQLLLAGSDLSRAGTKTTAILENTSSIRTIQDIQGALSAVTPLITRADNSLQSIDSQLMPLQQRTEFVSAVSAVHEVRKTLETASSTVNAVSDAIGSSTLRRYLVLFQNNSELRPTGGFIGSYALVDVMNGQLKKVEIPPGGPYDLRAGFHERLNPPQPLRLVASRWEFQDANWWADFPTSARKLLWFYEKAGGPTVDGVIAINASLLPRLLSFSSPLELKQYGKTLDQGNALDELQRAVEVEYDRADNKPKQIIADAFPLLLASLSNVKPESIPLILSTLIDALSRREIQLYFRNEEYQSLAQQFDITGEMKNFSPDYSMIVSTNIGGAKTDAVIDTDVSRELRVESDGSIIVSLTLQRSHRGLRGDMFTGVQHNDYVRFYTPVGSQLISAVGFDSLGENGLKPSLPNSTDDQDILLAQKDTIHSEVMNIDTWKEQGRGVFGGWILTKPSSTKTVTLTYALPYRFDELFEGGQTGMYAVFLQRQSGSTISKMRSTFEIPANYRLEWNKNLPCSQNSSSNTLTCSMDNFHTDQFIGFIMRYHD